MTRNETRALLNQTETFTVQQMESLLPLPFLDLMEANGMDETPWPEANCEFLDFLFRAHGAVSRRA